MDPIDQLKFVRALENTDYAARTLANMRYKQAHPLPEEMPPCLGDIDTKDENCAYCPFSKNCLDCKEDAV